MIKKIVLTSVGLLLVSSPLLVSAQTTTSTNASLIAALTALVQQLEQELQQLIAAKSSTPPTQPTTPISPSSFANLCAAYAHLKKTDTDATTGGQVTQLQQFLGISPATGYYGALTSIGYNNRCVGGNAQPTSVAGMSKYTDSNFGFSFWYPSSWTVTPLPIAGAGGNAEKLEISANNQAGYYINAQYAPNGISEPSDNCTELYYFSSASAEWMQTQSDCDSPTTTQAADVSMNTMGGLHEFNGGGNVEGYYATIVPLSASNFVSVQGFGAGIYGGTQKLLADTIVATNPSVAIPVSTAQQTATIQAEANAYGVNTSNSSTLSGSPTSGTAPLTVTFTGTAVNLAYKLDFGDGSQPTQTGCGECGGYQPTKVTQTHTYPTPGTYTATLTSFNQTSSSNPSVTTVVTVTGSQQTSLLQTYTNSQYGFSVQYPANMQQPSTAYPVEAVLSSSPALFLADTHGEDVAIWASSVPSDVVDCLTGPYGTAGTNSNPVSINGVNFRMFAGIDPATGQVGLSHVYTTLRNNTCFVLESGFVGAALGHLSGLDKVTEQANQIQTFANLDSSIQSFRFTQ